MDLGLGTTGIPVTACQPLARTSERANTISSGYLYQLSYTVHINHHIHVSRRTLYNVVGLDPRFKIASHDTS